nr:MAG TPA: hypothetical protein [Herelleviridae sp.]
MLRVSSVYTGLTFLLLGTSNYISHKFKVLTCFVLS